MRNAFPMDRVPAQWPRRRLAAITKWRLCEAIWPATDGMACVQNIRRDAADTLI